MEAVSRISSPLTRISRAYNLSKAGTGDFSCKDMFDFSQDHGCCFFSKKSNFLRHSLSEYSKQNLSCRWLEFKKHYRPSYYKTRKLTRLTTLASMDESVTVNGSPQASSSNEIEDIRVKLDQSLKGEDVSLRLVQSIHDAARSIELAILEHSSSSKVPWFSKAWLGFDKNAWVKTLSYQAAVYSLLQAAIEISSWGDGRDRDINIFVQRSLSRLCGPLESVVRDELSSKQADAYDWFWSQQYPIVVASFVNVFENEAKFNAATTICLNGQTSGSGIASDLSLLMLSLSCLAAITKLGPTKVSCTQFFSLIPEVTGRLMDMLVDFVPIKKAYSSMKDIRLQREFLFHFGPRAAASIAKSDQRAEEVAFWVELVQKQLQRAIARERIWSRLTTCESIEVIEKDLAIFGFFIALGKSTQSFLSSKGFSVTDHPIEGIIRYLIGGSVLYYPQLSSISSYQLYLEVVCEELEWLPFYQIKSGSLKQNYDNRDATAGTSNEAAISDVVDVCSFWMTSFIKYSTWLAYPSNIKAARFLSRGHEKLVLCKKSLGIKKDSSDIWDQQSQKRHALDSTISNLDSFDKALESVEQAVKRLEDLLQELHLSNSNTGKEQLKAACSDLERIRKLKKEAEFLEASFRAKAESLEEEESNILSSPTSESEQNAKERSGGFWSFLVRNSTRRAETQSEQLENKVFATETEKGDSESDDIYRFELLRRELIELEKRVQRSTEEVRTTEEPDLIGDNDQAAMKTSMLVKAEKRPNIFTKSINKLKNTSTDVLQGTQLLAIDVAAASVLLRRSLTGDELTEKEKKALRRTLTDMASVLPIGFLMLLPVTAVGHAAMLAAIQRYVPALIPSTYGPERLDLLRQLEKVKEEMESADGGPDESPSTISSSSSTENL